MKKALRVIIDIPLIIIALTFGLPAILFGCLLYLLFRNRLSWWIVFLMSIPVALFCWYFGFRFSFGEIPPSNPVMIMINALLFCGFSGFGYHELKSFFTKRAEQGAAANP